MESPLNLITASSYAIIIGSLIWLSWQVRRGIPAKQIICWLAAASLILGSCAVQHIGHAFNTTWAPLATQICSWSSLAGVGIIWSLAKPLCVAVKTLADDATYDSLTRLHNRQSASRTLSVLSETATSPFSLVLLDIDHFKSINDTYGHTHGDVVLAKTAQAIVNQLRQSDTAARWGGEEFLVILPGCQLKDATKLSQDIVSTVRVQGDCTISAGVAEVRAGGSIDKALSLADKALYKAKHGGRDRVAVGAT